MNQKEVNVHEIRNNKDEIFSSSSSNSSMQVDEGSSELEFEKGQQMVDADFYVEHMSRDDAELLEAI